MLNPNDPSTVSVGFPSLPVKVTTTTGEWLVYELQIHTATNTKIQKIDVQQGDKLLLTYTDFVTKDDWSTALI